MELYHGSPTHGIEKFVLDNKYKRHELPHEGEAFISLKTQKWLVVTQVPMEHFTQSGCFLAQCLMLPLLRNLNAV